MELGVGWLFMKGKGELNSGLEKKGKGSFGTWKICDSSQHLFKRFICQLLFRKGYFLFIDTDLAGEFIFFPDMDG